MTSCEQQKPTRPYTDYNLFFQLEREYILQVRLGVSPALDLSEVFDPRCKRYHGPPLPFRYKDLVLPYDWHIPGKAQRRKRRHRKSHGKIGFHELSNMIAQAWSKVDEETRSFCACLSDIGTLQYKNAMRAYQLGISHKHELKQSNQESECTKKIKKNEAYDNKDNASHANQLQPGAFSPRPDCAKSSMALSRCDVKIFNENVSDEDVDLYLNFLRSKVQAINTRVSSESLVDMGDDEIRCMWNSISNENQYQQSQSHSDKAAPPQVVSNAQRCAVDVPMCWEVSQDDYKDELAQMKFNCVVGAKDLVPRSWQNKRPICGVAARQA